MALVLEGIKVIDVAQVAAVPMCARHLADFGADVIHIENPATGDSWRALQATPVKPGAGVPSEFPYNWENFNRNKRGMSLDLSQVGGQQVLYRLIEQADVFVTNLRLWEQRKFNLGYDTLKKLNPRLIYGSVTGYGKNGPDNEVPAYDITAFWGRAGVTQTLTALGMSGPMPRAAVGDVVAGLGLAFGVMTALFHRDRTGVGQEVDISLFHTGIYQVSFDASSAAATGDAHEELRVNPPSEDPERRLRRLELMAEAQEATMKLAEFYREATPNPLAGHYLTKDGRRLIFNAMHSDRYWVPFCRAIEREDLIDDERYNTMEARTAKGGELARIFRDAFLSRTLEEWKPRLHGLPFSPLQNLSEAVKDPQAVANGIFPEFDHPVHGPVRVIANPVNLSETPATIRTAAPEFSQHTEEIMLELGYSWEDIAGLKEQGVIA